MQRVEAIRSEVHRLIRATPFRKFVLILDSGDRVLIEHPENIAFDPEAKGPDALRGIVVTGMDPPNSAARPCSFGTAGTRPCWSNRSSSPN